MLRVKVKILISVSRFPSYRPVTSNNHLLSCSTVQLAILFHFICKLYIARVIQVAVSFPTSLSSLPLRCHRHTFSIVSVSTVLEPTLEVSVRSVHTSRVDVQLNSTMRLISGTICSTPLPWLPVLSNTEQPALRRKADTDKLVEKIAKHDSWPPGTLL